MSGTNFRGVRKLSPKPSAFESEIHPTHKPVGLCSGDFALPGAIHAGVDLQSERAGLYYPCRPRGRGAWRAALLMAAFQGKCAAPPAGLRKAKSFCGCQKAAAVNRTDTGISSVPSRPVTAAYMKAAASDYPPKEGERHL